MLEREEIYFVSSWLVTVSLGNQIRLPALNKYTIENYKNLSTFNNVIPANKVKYIYIKMNCYIRCKIILACLESAMVKSDSSDVI